MLTGSCYCGACAFTLDDSPTAGVICQCVTCQKLHSHNSYNVQSEAAKLVVTKGTPTIYLDDKSDSGKAIRRAFCSLCGSALFSTPDSMPGAVFIKVGSLDQAQSIKLAAEIYVESGFAHSTPDKAVHGQTRFEGMMAKMV